MKNYSGNTFQITNRENSMNAHDVHIYMDGHEITTVHKMQLEIAVDGVPHLILDIVPTNLILKTVQEAIVSADVHR